MSDVATVPPPPSTGDADESNQPVHPTPAGRIDTSVLLVGIGVVCGLLSLVDFLPGLIRLVFVLAFTALAPGNAMLVWWRGLSRAARVGLPPALGLAIMTLALTAEVNLPWWHTDLTLLIVAGLSVVSVAVWMKVRRRAADLDGPASESSEDELGWSAPTVSRGRHTERTRASRLAVPVLVSLALISWATSLPTIGHPKPSAYGLLAAASPGYALSIVIAALAGLVAIKRRNIPGIFAATGAFVLIERLSLTLATEVPLYPWTYKHIAIVDYIDRFDKVTHGVDIYHDWPGMFAMTAWVQQISGFTPVEIAHWFTPVYHVLLLPLVYAAARAWRLPPLVAATTTFIFEVCSFVAQDYFSPQAFGVLLGVAVLLMLGESTAKRAVSVPALVVFAAITVSHQLTPYWIILVVATLVIFRRVRSWWLPFAFAALAGGYALLNYARLKEYGVVSSTDPLTNIQLRQQATPLFGIRTQFYATAFVYVLFFIGSAVLILIAFRKKREWRAPACVALSPVLLLAVQGYGGEAIFRIMLYCLPGLAAIAAVVLIRALAASHRMVVPTVALGMVTALIAGHALLGSYSAYRVSKSQVAAWQWFNRDTATKSRMYSLGPGFPGNPEWYYVPRITQQNRYTGPIFGFSNAVQTNFASRADYESLNDIILPFAGNELPFYLVLSPQIQAYAHVYGVFKDGTTANVRTYMSKDPRWQQVFTDDGLVIFRLVRPGAG